MSEPVAWMHLRKPYLTKQWEGDTALYPSYEIERKDAAIAELVEALKYYADAVCAGESPGGGYYSIEDDGHIARAAIAKYDMPKDGL